MTSVSYLRALIERATVTTNDTESSKDAEHAIANDDKDDCNYDGSGTRFSDVFFRCSAEAKSFKALCTLYPATVVPLSSLYQRGCLDDSETSLPLASLRGLREAGVVEISGLGLYGSRAFLGFSIGLPERLVTNPDQLL